MRTTIIIPARLCSTRLDKKLLLPGPDNKTVLQHAWENACNAKLAESVYITTDSGQIKHTAEAFGANVIFLDAGNYKTGTDRVAATVYHLPKEPDLIINMQADEVELRGDDIDKLITLHGYETVSTAAVKLIDYEEYISPETVKVVFDKTTRHARIFSRGLIPYMPNNYFYWILQGKGPRAYAYKHVGIYLYRKDVLRHFSTLDRSVNEQVESLEQLRLIDADIPIKVHCIGENGLHPKWPISINTQESYNQWLAHSSA